MATHSPTAPDAAQRAQTINGIFMPEDVFSADECRRIRELAEKLKHDGGLQQSGMYDGEGKALDTDYRQSRVRFVMPEPDNIWIFERLRDLVIPMNRSVYQFDLAGFEEGVQIAEYPVGNGYGWHTDIGANRTSRRKLSITLQLSAADEYDGGELEFMNPEHAAVRKMGAVVVFPSFMLHRVRPITRGTRWSLVSWVCGPPFR